MKETMDERAITGEQPLRGKDRQLAQARELIASLQARLAVAELGRDVVHELGMRHLTRAEVAEQELAVVKADVTRLTNTFMAEIGSIVR